jgi:hypothetical protein
MKVAAINLSRVLAFVELSDLNPRGAVSMTRITPTLVDKASFRLFPTTLEQFDETKGITFEDGIWDGIPVEKMTVYNNGIMMDTRSGTDVSLRLIREILAWSVNEFGLVLPENALQRIRFLNQFTFYSDALAKLGWSPIRGLADSLSEHLAEITGKSREYQVVRIDIDFDRLEQQVPIAPLTIQRRGLASFEDNKFYTEAPLPTDAHIALIGEFESSLLAL